MRPDKTFHVLNLGWLVAIALLAGQVGAAEQATLAPGGAGKRVASDAAKRAVTAAAAGREEILSPHLSELEQRLFDQIHDGRFGHFSLLQAGLIAGGVERWDELDRYCKHFDALVESLRRSGKVRGTPRERAQALFAFLHQAILRGGYSLQASDLRQALDCGRFNCVTASLLFNCLADRFELKAVGLEIPGHAMSRLELPEETLDIETTCPRWFTRIDWSSEKPPTQVGNPAQAEPQTTVRAEVARNSLARTAASDQRLLRQVSEVELVATIYYNRGVDLLAERRFADAAAANAKAVRLDPENATAKGNFLATINNWAIDLGTAGEYARAAELLRLGLAADANYEPFHSNYVQLFRQWSEDLCRRGRYADAVRLLTQAAQEQPGERFFREATIEALRRWAEK
jgi:tetratricopeptide (TPR) repeat protein